MPKKLPIRARPPAANVPPDHVNDQKASVMENKNTMAEKNTQMNAYTSYSYFMEETVGLGRNGKRLAHGGVVAGGTWAAGRYGGVEIINNNLPAALGIGAAAGFLGTVAMDKMFIDSEQEALMRIQKYRDSNPEIQKKVQEMLPDLLNEIRKTG